jgi:dTMP kinase
MNPINNSYSEIFKDNKTPSGFFVVEGIEGSGKSTLINSLVKSFTENKVKITQTREPGGTDLGSKLREVLLSKSDIKISSLSELLIFYSDRAQHLEEVIKPALSNNELLICDRFIYSTIAYQSFGRGIDRSIIETLNNVVVEKLKPKGVILLDIDPNESLARASNRGQLDRFESENLEFHLRIRKGYLQLAQENSDIFKIIDANQSKESILETTLKFIFSKENAST